MAEITANLVKELREKTGAGMMDCKKALAETSGDIESASDWLRKKGLAAASKKAGRVAAEGLVGAKVSGNKGVIIEINSETDFVSRNEKFQELTSNLLDCAFENNIDKEKFLELTYPKTNVKIAEEISNNIAIIGENITLRRLAHVNVQNGVVVSYIHNAISENLGKIAVIIGIESTANIEELKNLGKQIAMHIAAARPEVLNIEAVDAQNLERERNIFREQAASSGKPENVIEKMIEGRIRKYYEEIVLLEQIFVIDGKTKISEFVESQAKKLGTEIKITGFARFQLGEGIEKQETDFQAEVASMTGKK